MGYHEWCSFLLILAFNLFQFSSTQPNEPLNALRLRTAKEPLKTLLVNNPELIYSYQFNLELGKSYLNLKQYQKGQKYFTNALSLAEIDSDKSAALYYLGRTYMLLKKGDSATKYLGKVLDYDRNPGLDFLYLYGIALFQSGKYQDALSSLSNLYQQLKIDSLPKRRFPLLLKNEEKWLGNQNELLALLGLLYLQTGKSSQAQSFFQKIPVEVRAKTMPEVNYLLAMVHYQNGELAAADSIIQNTARTYPAYLRRKSDLLRGTIQLEQGNTSLAAQMFEAITRDTAQFLKDQAFLRAGWANFRKRKYDSAIRFFQELYNNFPDSDLNEYGLFYLVETYLKLKQNRRAIEKNQELAVRFPKSEFLKSAIFDIAQIQYKNQDFAQAQREFKNYLTRFPYSHKAEEALYYGGLSAVKIKDESEAIISFQPLIDRFPNSSYAIEANYQIGLIQLNRQNYALAKKIFTKINQGKFYPYALKGIGDACFGLEQYDKALRFYRRAEKIIDKNLTSAPVTADQDTFITDLHYAIELTSFKNKKYPGYIDMLNSYLAKYPGAYNGAKLQLEIGQYYFARNDFNQAVNQYYKVFNYYPDQPLVAKTYLYIGQAQLKLQAYPEAINTFQYILTNFNDTVSVISALNNLAEIYTQRLAYDSAILYRQTLLAKYPKSPPAENSLLGLAQLYRKINKTLEAKMMLDRLIQEYPNSELLQPAYLQMLDILITEGNLTYGETIADNFIKKFGPSPEIDLRLGKIRQEQNQWPAAKKLYLNAANRFTADQKAEALILAADAAIKLKEPQNARNWLNQAIKVAEDERLRLKCQELLINLKEP